MSLLKGVYDLHLSLAGEHKRARERWSEGGEGGDMDDETVDGVLVQIRYEGSNRNTDYRTVLLDGYHFARECETIPWNVFKDITTSYVCYTFLTLPTLRALLSELKLTDEFDLQEEYYPAEDRVVRYNCHTRKLENVIALWKAWRDRYMQEVEAIA